MAEDSASRFERYRHILTALIVLAIIGGGAAFVLLRPAPTAITIIPPGPTATPAPTATPDPIEVYVTGAVLNPEMVVILPYGSRVEDAILAAGGFAPGADQTRVNLAQPLRDGDQVHVYAVEAVMSGHAAGDVVLATPGDSGIVYVNVATLEELDVLPGIGPALGQRIIDYREQNGPFTSLQDLDNVSGIGPATLERLAPLVSFDIP